MSNERPEPEHLLTASVLRLPEAQGVAEELAEAGIEAFVNNPAVDAIPIVKCVAALAKGVGAMREAYLNKKLLLLLYGIGQATDEDMWRWAKRLEDDSDVQETGERVLAVVDHVTSTWKAQLIGQIFRSYLDGVTSRADFLRVVEMIDAALTEDLKFLLEDYSADNPDEAISQRLLAVGLMRDNSIYRVTGGSGPPTPSAAGELLRQLRSTP